MCYIDCLIGYVLWSNCCFLSCVIMPNGCIDIAYLFKIIALKRSRYWLIRKTWPKPTLRCVLWFAIRNTLFLKEKAKKRFLCDQSLILGLTYKIVDALFSVNIIFRVIIIKLRLRLSFCHLVYDQSRMVSFLSFSRFSNEFVMVNLNMHLTSNGCLR